VELNLNRKKEKIVMTNIYDVDAFQFIILACFCLLLLTVIIVGGLVLYNSSRKKDTGKGSVDVIDEVSEGGEEGEEDSKACPSCGAQNPAENNFCQYCGEKL
jgi:hypothetical protein